MKHFKFTTLLLLIGAFFFVQPSYAMIETHNAQSTATIEKQTKDLKKEFKAQKRMAKLEKLFNRAGVDFKDPVNKWMWFWIFGWAAALVLAIIGVAIVAGTVGTGFGIGSIIALIGWLAGLFGTISLIIWIVKKFA
jgi:ABC-type multidrug transport system fused ATPase/permease subunit